MSADISSATNTGNRLSRVPNKSSIATSPSQMIVSPERCPWSPGSSRFSLSQVKCCARKEDTPVCMSATSAFEYSENLP